MRVLVLVLVLIALVLLMLAAGRAVYIAAGVILTAAVGLALDGRVRS